MSDSYYDVIFTALRGLATKHASLAISASKHGGQLVNEFFTYLKDITLNSGYLKGWRIFEVTSVIPGPKILPATRVQGSYQS